MAWVGSLPHKGLGVFGFGAYSVELASCFDDRLEWVAPIEVRGPLPFALLAVWAQNHRANVQHPDYSAMTQPAAAMDLYRPWFDGRDLVVAGDFNHNVRWDRPRATSRNHAVTVDACRVAGLRSAYHSFTGEEQGRELTPTIFWRDRTQDGPSYHIDFAFLPEAWISRLERVEVGSHVDWVATGLSDHAPIVVDVDPPVSSPRTL